MLAKQDPLLAAGLVTRAKAMSWQKMRNIPPGKLAPFFQKHQRCKGIGLSQIWCWSVKAHQRMAMMARMAGKQLSASWAIEHRIRSSFITLRKYPNMMCVCVHMNRYLIDMCTYVYKHKYAYIIHVYMYTCLQLMSIGSSCELDQAQHDANARPGQAQIRQIGHVVRLEEKDVEIRWNPLKSKVSNQYNYAFGILLYFWDHLEIP